MTVQNCIYISLQLTMLIEISNEIGYSLRIGIDLYIKWSVDWRLGFKAVQMATPMNDSAPRYLNVNIHEIACISLILSIIYLHDPIYVCKHLPSDANIQKHRSIPLISCGYAT